MVNLGGITTKKELIKSRQICSNCCKKLTHSGFKTTTDFKHWFCEACSK